MSFFVGDPSAPTRFGEDVAATGDPQGLFLKVFGGEVFGAYTEAVITEGRTYTRQIASGKSAQFPKTWKVEAEYHSAGQEMLGQTTSETERVITVDGLLVAHVGIYDLDEAMSHFEIRGRYSAELGRALARVYDKNVFRTVIKAARNSDSANGFVTTSPFPAGQVITSADTSGTISATAGSQWVEVMRELRIGAGQDNMPDGDTIWLTVPYTTFDVLKYAQVADTGTNPFWFNDIRRTFGAVTPEGTGVSSMVALDNVEAVRSNLIPQSNESADATVRAKYRGDFTPTLGVAWHMDGVGTVKLIGVGLEMARDARRQEDFLVAKMACGHGVVRNEGCWEITA